MIQRWNVTDPDGFEHVVEYDLASVSSFYAPDGFWGLSPNLPAQLGYILLQQSSGNVKNFKFSQQK